MVVCGGMEAQDYFMGLRGGFEKHCTRASLRSDTVEDLIRISVEGGGALEHPFVQTQWKI